MTLSLLSYRPGQNSDRAKVPSVMAFLLGGMLIIWSSYIHFHLWEHLGYRHIPTIGALFLVQSAAGALVGLAVLAVRRVWAGLLGMGFALVTLVGFLISVNRGLFGFKDASSAPFAHQALVIEVATIIVLAIAVALCLMGEAPAEVRMGPEATRPA